MNIIKDKILYSSLDPKPPPPNESYIVRLIAQIRHEIEKTGDRNWLVYTETGLTIPISTIEPKTRRVAGALSSLGFGPNDILQMRYSSCLDFYWPVFGAWLCGGAVIPETQICHKMPSNNK